jgi:flagellar assembly protein FliH
MPSLYRILKGDEVVERNTELLAVRRPAGSGAASRTPAEVLASARAEAEAILAAARNEAGQIREKARQEGFAEGHRQGLEAARRETEELRLQARRMLAEAEAVRRENLEGLTGEVIDLALDIAARVVARQITVDRETVLAIAREALQLVKDRERINLFAHPSEVPLLRERQQELLALLPERAVLSIVPDPQVRPGECRVETERGVVDAGLAARFEAVARALKGAGEEA